MQKVEPLEDRLLVTPDEPEAVTESGIHVVQDEMSQKTETGVVVAAGPGRMQDGARVPMQVSVGDRVMFGRYAGARVRLGDEEQVMISEQEVLVRVVE